MSRETHEQKRERFKASIATGTAKKYFDNVPGSPAQPPELLVEFFFQADQRKIARLSGEDIDQLYGHINEVLRIRREQLEYVRSLLHAAKCLDDLSAVAHYQQLFNAINGIVQAYAWLFSDV